MKVATWNVNGIRAREAQFAEWLAHEQPDVVCLQEIKASPAQVPEQLCSIGGYWCYWHGAGGYSGVALHVRRDRFPEEPVFSHPEFNNESRIAQTQLGNTIFASVYVPNGGKDYDAKMAFLREIDGFVKKTHDAGLDLVLSGDINIAHADIDVHPKERKPNVIGQRPEEREMLDRILGRGLVDVGRKMHPEDAEFFTWWPPWRSMRQRNIGWRIDYILASERLA